MDRRQFICAVSSGMGILPGCSTTNQRSESPTMTPSTPGRGRVSVASSRTESPRENPNTLFVSPDGSDSNPGTADSPIDSIQEAIDRAEPGDTVHARPGVYEEHLETVRPGQPDDPITITGPEDAVLRHRGVEGQKDWGVVVQHSHVYLAGLTLDGLRNPDKPDARRSYGWMNVACLPGGIDRAMNPEKHEPETYLRDVKITPHGVGNTRGPAIHPILTNTLEIGEFRVHGPTGLDYLEFDRYGHVGEILYLGLAPSSDYKLNGGTVDRSHDIHIHHIDASTEHPHIGGFPDIKAGVHGVTMEYCTSVNSTLPSDNDHASVAHIGGHDVTFRWNRIELAVDRGVDVGNYRDDHRRRHRRPGHGTPSMATNSWIWAGKPSITRPKRVRPTNV